MAWNKYYIIVKSPKLTDAKEILTKLNLVKYKPTKEVPLHYSNKPETLFTGFYNDNFIIVHPDLAFHFFSETQTEIEKLFISLENPDNEIDINSLDLRIKVHYPGIETYAFAKSFQSKFNQIIDTVYTFNIKGQGIDNER